MAKIKLEQLTRKYGPVTAVDNVNLDIHDDEFLVLVGPSGCGKTTTLRMVAGLEDISSGSVYIGDRRVNDVEPKDRDIAIVFQSYALYPHMSVYDNMAFGLKMRKVAPNEIERRIQEASSMLGIGHLLKRKPKELSGGQRQRVALGRAIVREPAVFLMDEPLSNLDAKLRVQTRAEIARLHQRLKTTIVYVTHDQVEAMTMGQRIAVMSLAKLQQVGPPQELYDHPLNKFVAGFIGSPSMNFLPVELSGSGDSAVLTAPGFTVPLPPAFRDAVGATTGSKFTLGIRPEHIDVADTGGLVASAQAKADVVEYLGNEELLHIIVAGTDVVAVVSSDRNVRPGDVVTLHLPLEKIHLFDGTTEASLLRSR